MIDKKKIIIIIHKKNIVIEKYEHMITTSIVRARGRQLIK